MSMHDELLAFLEADLVRADPPPARGCHLADPARLIDRVAELANADWSEAEAASELGRLASVECLRAAHAVVVGALMRNPLVDVRGIRMARILLAALAEHHVPLPVRATASRRRGLLARLFRGR
jgi:hypothetical protein